MILALPLALLILASPKGAELFPAVVQPPAQSWLVAAQWPAGFVASNYVISLEMTYEPQFGHWWQAPISTNDIGPDGIPNIKADKPWCLYRWRATPKSILPK